MILFCQILLQTHSMKKLLLLVLISVSMLASCRFASGKRIQGNSDIESEERVVSSFSRVDVRGAIKVNVAQGDVKKVRIESDENLIPYIEITQEGDKLIIKTKDGYNLEPTGDMRVYVTAPLFKSIYVSGACDIIGQNKITNSEEMKLHVSGAGDIKMEVDAPAVDIEVSGSGTVNLKGETKDFDLKLSGAANAHCYDLLAENTKVVISGAGDAEVYASVKLDAHVSGAGVVSYKGDARDINQSVSGAGSVKKKQ
jgi:hypothetical protein